MKEIILIEIIFFVSFLYSITSMYYTFTHLNQILLLFLWTIGVATFYGINKEKSIIYRLSIILLLLPLLYFKGGGPMYFIVITGILVFLYAKTSLYKGNHYDYISKFKATFTISMVAIYIKYIYGGITETLTTSDYPRPSLNYAGPFLIMYVLTSIILTRLIRHIEFNKDTKSIRRLNIKYLITTGVIFIITVVEQIRNFITMGFSKIVDIMAMILFYPMYWITRWINIKTEDAELVEEIEIGGVDPSLGEFVEGDIGSMMDKQGPMDFTILRRIAGCILVVLLIYLVYRLLAKSNNRTNDNLDYIEEREYMEKTKRKKANIFQNIFYPKDLGDQIRFYYRKFLKKLDKAEIEVGSSDTSFEINQKAKAEFGDQVEEIRDLYINSRYGEKSPNKATVEKMKNLYKDL